MPAKYSPQVLDVHQLRVLLRTALRLDWRGASNPFTAMSTKRSKIPGLLVVIVFDVLVSLLFGAVLEKMPGLFEGLVITGLGPFVLVALAVLIEFSQIIITPADYHVIASHPVNSRTFFTAKLAHLLTYVTILALSCALFPAVIARFAFGTILASLAVVIHYWLVSVFAAVFIITVFVALLRGANRRRMEKFVSYAQIVLLLSFYFSMNYIPSHLESISRLAQVDRIPWIAFLPTYWFAAPVGLVTAGFDWPLFGAAAVGFLLLATLLKFSTGYLSVSYARSLAEPSAVTTTTRRRRLPLGVRRLWNRHTCPELRALALLAWAQFKNDLSFRLQVVWIIPVTLFFLLYGLLADMPISDPFAQSASGDGGNPMYGMFLVMAPGMIYTAMVQTKAWRAAWVFYVTPIDRRRMVLASKWLCLGLLAFPVAPVLLIVLSFIYGNVLHALMQVVFLLAIATLSLTLMVTFAPRLPFATEKAYGSWTGEAFLVYFVSMILLAVPVVVISVVGYGGFLGWVGFTLGTVLVALALTRLQNRRIDAKVRLWEMAG